MRPVTSYSTPQAHLVGPGKLKVSNRRLTYSIPNQSPLKLNSDRLERLFIYGGVSLSDEAIGQLLKQNVETAVMSQSGHKCHGRMVSEFEPSVRHRMIQMQLMMFPHLRLIHAKHIIKQKIQSQLDSCRHLQRHGHGKGLSLIKPLIKLKTQADAVTTHAQLLGVEGTATRNWYQCLGAAIQDPFEFGTRSRRPPRNAVNALLSLAYTWLTNRITAVGKGYGLESRVGVLHEMHPGRPSLACDLIEPLRVLAVDRWVIKICNQGTVKTEDFRTTDDGAVLLQHGLMSRFLGLWEDWTIRHDILAQVHNLVGELTNYLNTIEPEIHRQFPSTS